MSKYIKVDDIKSALCEAVDKGVQLRRGTTIAIIKILGTVPTIDIVHCKECIHNNTVNCPKSWFDEHLLDYKTCNDDNDFCSDGEREDNE